MTYFRLKWRTLRTAYARFPHDIAALARYGPATAQLPTARAPWTPLHPLKALQGLADAGLASTHIVVDTGAASDG